MIEYYDTAGNALGSQPDGSVVHIRVNRAIGEAGVGTVRPNALAAMGKRIMRLWEDGSLGQLRRSDGQMPNLFVVTTDHPGWPPGLRRKR